jgi:glycine reductase
MRVLERQHRIGRLYPRYFATVGNATSVERARRYGAEIAAKLVNEGVQAVVFTST